MENLSNFENRLNDAVNHFSNELKKIRVSGISAQLVEDVQVQAYGITQPLKSLASVFSVSESELNVEVYDQWVRQSVIAALAGANLGANPQDSGGKIRLVVPPATLERREELVKLLKKKKEEAKIAVRNARQDFLKSLSSEGLPEDAEKRAKTSFESSVKKSEEALESSSSEKESELLGNWKKKK